MIGYHYTTAKAWEDIREHGLFPNPIRPHELERFRKSMPLMPEEAIWVWKSRLSRDKAWMVTALLAEIHRDFDMVLLEIEYGPEDAMSICFGPGNGDVVKLHSSFSVGNRLHTGEQPIELLHRHVPPENTNLIWSGNLLDQFQNHPETECVQAI